MVVVYVLLGLGGSFPSCRTFSEGSVFAFWWVVRYMMPMGPGPRFAPWLG